MIKKGTYKKRWVAPRAEGLWRMIGCIKRTIIGNMTLAPQTTDERNACKGLLKKSCERDPGRHTLEEES